MALLKILQRKTRKAITLGAIKATELFEAASAPFQERKPVDLLIVDDFFPGVLSAFRVAEYNYYLQNIGSTEVHSRRQSNMFFPSHGSFQEALAEYCKTYPEHRERIKRYRKSTPPRAALLYTVFINNIHPIIDTIDRYGIPFCFTLYPGGGFQMHDPEAEMKLQRVFSSPNFKKVFVTQKISREYLLEKRYCGADDIEFVYGCVLPVEKLTSSAVPKRCFPVDKSSFDVCFVAAKYTEKGRDKGYDTFISVATQLAAKCPDIRFHVVGNFDHSDIDVSSLGDRITFYGLRNTDFFPGFYSRMDAVLSPNLPFVLAPGAFDGFPTGSCMEAGLCGVAVFCTDPLQQNVCFKDREEIVIIPKEADGIVRLLEEYYSDPPRLYGLAERGRKAFLEAFDLEKQMSERVRVLRSLLPAAGGDGAGLDEPR